MAYTEFDFTSYQATAASILESLRSEVESKIHDLLSESKSVSAYAPSYNSYINDIGEITYDDIGNAIDLVSAIEFTPVETRQFDTSTNTPSDTHTFISQSLDTIEDKILAYISAAGTETISNLSASAISDLDITNLLNGASRFDTEMLNNNIDMLNMYPSPSTDANISWLNQINAFKLEDRNRRFFKDLFDLAQDNANWMRNQAVGVESAHASFTEQYNSVVSNVIDAQIAAYKAEVLANISQLELKIKKANAEMSVQDIETTLRTEEYQMAVQQYATRMSSYVSAYRSALSANAGMLGERMNGTEAAAAIYKKLIVGHAQSFGAVSLGRQ